MKTYCLHEGLHLHSPSKVVYCLAFSDAEGPTTSQLPVICCKLAHYGCLQYVETKQTFHWNTNSWWSYCHSLVYKSTSQGCSEDAAEKPKTHWGLRTRRALWEGDEVEFVSFGTFSNNSIYTAVSWTQWITQWVVVNGTTFYWINWPTVETSKVRFVNQTQHPQFWLDSNLLFSCFRV